MNQIDYCPIPMEDGSDCWREPAESAFRGMCEPHMRELVEAWIITPKITTLKCMNCDERFASRLFVDRLAMCTTCGVPLVCEAWMPGRDFQADTRPAKPKRPRTDVVYYLRFGDRVKIGTTTDLPRRVKQIPHDEILAIEPGDISQEHGRHRMFSDLLIPGQQEWFKIDDRLIAHVTHIRAKASPPMEAWRRWITRAA